MTNLASTGSDRLWDGADYSPPAGRRKPDWRAAALALALIGPIATASAGEPEPVSDAAAITDALRDHTFYAEMHLRVRGTASTVSCRPSDAIAVACRTGTTIYAEETLLEEVGKLTGREMVLNTSFNVKGQPIVNTPREAIDTFLGTGIEYLFLENTLVRRVAQK